MFTLLVDADLYVPAHRGRSSLLVAAGRIVHLADTPPDLDPGLEVQRVDLDGRPVIPGLVDGHVHITGGGGEGGPGTSLPAPPLRDYATAGVTSVVGMLGTDDVVRTPGTVVARARALRSRGLSAWCCTGGYHLPPATVTGSVRGDLVHVDPVIGVGEVAISDHRSSAPITAELLRVASDARVGGLLAGKAGTLHLHVGNSDGGLDPVDRMLAVGDLPASVLHPTHVNRTPALLEHAIALARRGLTVDATALPPDVDGKDVAATDVVRRWLGDDLPRGALTVSSDAGGSLPSFGADGRVASAPVGTPGVLADLVAGLVEDGIALGDALPFVTTNPARQWRLPRKGRLEVGADADLVVLGEDHRPRDVMARGRWLVRGGVGTPDAPTGANVDALDAATSDPSQERPR